MCQFSPTYLRPSTAEQAGLASIYSHESGSRTASSQKLNGGALTAAHRTLPLGSKVKVTNKRNGRSVIVTINDRGPFVRGRVIDVTPAAARSLGFSGLTQVTLNSLGHSRGWHDARFVQQRPSAAVGDADSAATQSGSNVADVLLRSAFGRMAALIVIPSNPFGPHISPAPVVTALQ
jgi:rare lipoprotein A